MFSKCGPPAIRKMTFSKWAERVFVPEGNKDYRTSDMKRGAPRTRSFFLATFCTINFKRFWTGQRTPVLIVAHIIIFVVVVGNIYTIRLLGRIHLPHLQICKYFMDDSSENFQTRFFFIFRQIFAKKNEEKPCHGKLRMSRP